jgi:uncharacterized protein with PIN domain
MILDSSALVAIFTQESGHEGLIDAVAEAPAAGVAAPTLVDFRKTDVPVLPA